MAVVSTLPLHPRTERKYADVSVLCRLGLRRPRNLSAHLPPYLRIGPLLRN